MNRIFILATAVALITSCSNDSKEEPTNTEIRTEEKVVSTPQPAADTSTAVLPPATMPPRPDHTSGVKADIRSSKNSSTITTTTQTGQATVGKTAPAAAPPDGNQTRMVVPKGQEEEAMRKKIRENNSIDGGGQ